MGKDEIIGKDTVTTDMNAAESKGTSFINRKERLVEEAKSFNLLSNVFMSVALNCNDFKIRYAMGGI